MRLIFRPCNLFFSEPTPPADSDAIVPVCLGVLECVTQVVLVAVIVVMIIKAVMLLVVEVMLTMAVTMLVWQW
jgi:hypothetical protein